MGTHVHSAYKYWDPKGHGAWCVYVGGAVDGPARSLGVLSIWVF